MCTKNKTAENIPFALFVSSAGAAAKKTWKYNKHFNKSQPLIHIAIAGLTELANGHPLYPTPPNTTQSM